MPMYDHECGQCGHIHEAFKNFSDKFSDCPDCGGVARRIVSFGRSARTIDVFQPQRFEELGDDAPMVESKAQLARLCQERGLASRMLMDGYKSYERRKEY